MRRKDREREFIVDCVLRKDYVGLQRFLDTVRREDTLTGILNIEGFSQKATSLMQENESTQYALIRIAVGNFESINWAYGYDVGDTVLISVAKKLRRSCAEHEACGRVEGGDYALFVEYETKAELEIKLERLRTALLQVETDSDYSRPTFFRAGIYLPPIAGEEIRAMLGKAWIAQQHAPREGYKSSFAYFDPKDYEAHRAEGYLLEQAMDAMEQKEFCLYLQPQIDLKSMRVVAAEALVRWVRPDGTIIMPDDFLMLFEWEGLITELDFYMLETLCEHIRKWIDGGMELQHISINQSRLHAKEPGYIERFCEVVDRYGIPHQYLSVEITESAFMGNVKAMSGMAQALKKRGFSVEMDDFGSGYASFDLISILCPDKLKIDKNLILGLTAEENERETKMVQKVIEMAHEIGMQVICEGVETRRQFNSLLELGCDIAQGFLFYRPMPVKEFEHIACPAMHANKLTCMG